MNRLTHKIYPGKDLTQVQTYITLQTFDRRAKEYAENWEWNPGMIEEITKYNIKPFLKYVKKNGNCLIAECHSGRDYFLLSNAGLKCVGVSSSYGLLVEAQKRVSDGIFLYADLRSLPFMPNSFDSIYADALTRIPRQDVKKVIRDFKIFLRSKGYLYLSFRIGKESGIYSQEDVVGKRFLTIFEKSEIIKSITTLGFKIVWSAQSKHLEKSLPDWLSVIAQRVK